MIGCFVFLSVLVLVSGQTCKSSSQKIQVINNCKQYFSCTNLKPTISSCPVYFNCVTETCASSVHPACCPNDPNKKNVPQDRKCSPSGAKLANPFACSKYYECSNGQLKDKSCPSKQVFDLKTKTCKISSSSVC